jgi:hypothetical protein
VPRKQKRDDASRTVGQTIGEVTARPTGIKFEQLLITIEKHLNWSSINPLADADRINNLLDEIRAVWHRTSQGQVKEPNMVKDDPATDLNAVLTADHPALSPGLDALLADVVEHPQNWMSTPSAQFGGRRPIDLVGTEEEFKIFDILHAEVGALLGDPNEPISSPKGSWLLMSMHVRLHYVVDLSEPAQQRLISTNDQELTGVWVNASGGAPTQKLGAALHALPDLEGFIFPSSKAGSRNLAIFMDKLAATSSITFKNELNGRTERLD